MSHEISVQEGIAECFTAGDPAWHKLGANVKEAVTWKQAMDLAHLNWAVDKEQLSFKGEKVEAWGNFRADTKQFLGSVGPDYLPIQNKDAFDFVDTILQAENGAHYESAGALFDGKRIWCLARIPKEIRIKGTDDITNPYFLFSNRHDGINSAVGRLCTTRVVCNNTLQVALHEKGEVIKIRHTQNQEDQFKEAVKLVQAANNQIKDLDGLFNVLAKVKLNIAQTGEVIRMIYKNIDESVQEQNKARTVLDIFEDNDNNSFPSQKDSAYSLLNSFTKYEDHFSSVRITGNETDEQKARARKALFGIGDVLKFQVLTAITQTIHKNNLASFDTNIVKLDSVI